MMMMNTMQGTIPSRNVKKPKFPLSAYNLFFQVQRKRILEGIDHLDLPIGSNDVRTVADEYKARHGKRLHRKTHGKIGFRELARIVASRWKNIDRDTKRILEAAAQEEKEEYRIQLGKWKQSKQSLESKVEPSQTLVGFGDFLATASQVQTQLMGIQGPATNHREQWWTVEELLGVLACPKPRAVRCSNGALSSWECATHLLHRNEVRTTMFPMRQDSSFAMFDFDKDFMEILNDCYYLFEPMYSTAGESMTEQLRAHDELQDFDGSVSDKKGEAVFDFSSDPFEPTPFREN